MGENTSVSIDLETAVADPDEDAAVALVRDALDAGVPAMDLLRMGWAWSPVAQGMSMAEFSADPDAALAASLGALDDLNSVAEVDAVNNIFPGCFPPALAEDSWSKVDTPGFELGENELRQVREIEIMADEDYDTIIDHGWQASPDILQ